MDVTAVVEGDTIKLVAREPMTGISNFAGIRPDQALHLIRQLSRCAQIVLEAEIAGLKKG